MGDNNYVVGRGKVYLDGRYIANRLAGSNDEVGQEITRKIAELFSSRGC